MFENLKITAVMNSAVAIVDPLRLDCILSAAYAKEKLQDEYYSNGKVAGDKRLIVDTLSEFIEFDEESGIFHASCGFGEGNEFVISYSKRWSSAHDEAVSFKGKGKRIIDTARGSFKSYHKNLIYRTYSDIVFYVRGDKKRITELLDNIVYLGKKSSQGYGQVKKWVVENTEEDYSFYKNGKAMRYLPCTHFKCIPYSGVTFESLIPPAWRLDNRECCYVPGSCLEEEND